MKKKQLLILTSITTLLCAINIVGFFHRSYPSIMALELSQNLGISLSAVSLLSIVTVLVYGLMQIPTGILSDKIGATQSLFFLGIISVISCFGFALSTDFNYMLFYRMLMGIGFATVVSSQAILIRTIPVQHFATVNGIFFASGALGSILAGTPTIWLNSLLGWRMTLVIFSVVSVVLLFCLIPLLRVERTEKKVQESDPALSFLLSLKLILKTKDFWMLAIWLMCTLGVMWSLTTLWIGPYLMQACNLSQVQTGSVIISFSIGMIIAQPVFGLCADRFGISKKQLMILGSSVGALLSLFWVFGTEKLSFNFLLIHAFIMMFFVVGANPLAISVVKDKFKAQIMGLVLGCLCMSYPVWGGVLQLIYGGLLKLFLSWQFSLSLAYSYANLLWTISFVLGTLAILMLNEQKNEKAA